MQSQVEPRGIFELRAGCCVSDVTEISVPKQLRKKDPRATTLYQFSIIGVGPQVDKEGRTSRTNRISSREDRVGSDDDQYDSGDDEPYNSGGDNDNDVGGEVKTLAGRPTSTSNMPLAMKAQAQARFVKVRSTTVKEAEDNKVCPVRSVSASLPTRLSPLSRL